jgi:hypothetical protein
MNEISIALEYVRRKKLIRLKQNKIYRQKFRSKMISSACLSDAAGAEESMRNPITSTNLLVRDEEDLIEDIPCVPPTEDCREEKEAVENCGSSSSDYDHLEFNDICCDEQVPMPDTALHPYTTQGCLSFMRDFISFIRSANLSKSHANHLINLIQSSLPQPNALPKTYSNILNALSGKFIYLFLVFGIHVSTD